MEIGQEPPQKEVDIEGPNGSTDEEEIELVRKALKILGLRQPLDKEQARVCHAFEVVKKYVKRETRDREILD